MKSSPVPALRRLAVACVATSRPAPPDALRRERQAIARAGGVECAVVAPVSNTVVSFLPVFALTAGEGRLLEPLTCAKTFAIVSSAVLAAAAVPAACVDLLGDWRIRRARALGEVSVARTPDGCCARASPTGRSRCGSRIACSSMSCCSTSRSGAGGWHRTASARSRSRPAGAS